jgi:restriction system protein
MSDPADTYELKPVWEITGKNKSYQTEVRHHGLNKYHVLRSKDAVVLSQKAQALLARWEEMWNRKEEAEAKRQAREFQARSKEEKHNLAGTKTEQAEKEIHQLENVLSQGISQRKEIQWDRLKDSRSFAKPKPAEPYSPLLPIVYEPVYPPPPIEPLAPQIPKKPIPPDLTEKPSPDERRFQPVISVLDRMIPGQAQKKTKEAADFFIRELEAWNQKIRTYNDMVSTHNAYLLGLKQLHREKKESYRTLKREYEEECKRIKIEHQAIEERATRAHNDELGRIRAAHLERIKLWQQEKSEYYEEQAKRNRLIDERREAYLNCNATDIIEYCDMVLSNSEYPDYFPQDFEPDYIDEGRTLLVDYYLLRLEDVPTIKAWKYIQSKDEFSSAPLSETFRNKLYDDLICQIALRSLYELFAADAANALDAIVFNGRIKSIDKSTGQPFDACILSVHVKKQEFSEINLALVEPRACIKKLKGVASSKLHQMTPVAPILQIDRHDKRFVTSYEVAETLDDSANLAAMDWEDFEHLIREIFEKEFSANGGEVRVTQASHDGGVDAVVFDPDPIRGGKIVIQAKRYTNVVGVAAVRDLWGTINHEGAMKGILVTTATYGPDAYEFAKGKPITLLDGGHLLHLLERHGHRARIDIVEARKIAASRENQR